MGKKATLLLSRILLQWVTMLMATLTTAGWFAGIVSPDQSRLIAFISIGMGTLLIMNSALMLFWACSRSLWALLPLAAILLNISLVCSMFNIDLRTKEDLPPSDFKIATYNIHGYVHSDFNRTLSSITQYMKGQKVDIICMQEFIDQRDSLTDSILANQYPYRVVKSKYRGMQLAVFSRFPIIDSQIIQFHESFNCAMWADINVQGHKLRIFNLHLQTTNIGQSNEEIAKVQNLSIEDPESQQAMNIIMDRVGGNALKRAEQVRQVRSNIDNCPQDREIIVCGDFNDTPASYAYYQIKHGLQDGFKSAGSGYAYTFKPFYHLLRLDYIFHSQSIQGLTYCSPSLAWSDHNPVLMEFAFISTSKTSKNI